MCEINKIISVESTHHSIRSTGTINLNTENEKTCNGLKLGHSNDTGYVTAKGPFQVSFFLN